MDSANDLFIKPEIIVPIVRGFLDPLLGV